jgi:hypothetical protein
MGMDASGRVGYYKNQEGNMSDWDTSQDEEENVISLDDLEEMENEQDGQAENPDEDDWGDTYDDLDSEAWDRRYGQEDYEELDKDPWDLG